MGTPDESSLSMEEVCLLPAKLASSGHSGRFPEDILSPIFCLRNTFVRGAPAPSKSSDHCRPDLIVGNLSYSIGKPKCFAISFLIRDYLEIWLLLFKYMNYVLSFVVSFNFIVHDLKMVLYNFDSLEFVENFFGLCIT